MNESQPESPKKYSDPSRQKALRQYWAAVETWADRQGIEKNLVHSLLKSKLKFKHLYELKIQRLLDIAFEISTITAGGPGL